MRYTIKGPKQSAKVLASAIKSQDQWHMHFLVVHPDRGDKITIIDIKAHKPHKEVPG